MPISLEKYRKWKMGDIARLERYLLPKIGELLYTTKLKEKYASTWIIYICTNCGKDVFPQNSRIEYCYKCKEKIIYE